MEKNLLDPIPEKKIYKESAVRIGTFLGGPLVAGYLISENYKALGQIDKVKTTWLYTIIATVVILGLAFLIPDSIKIPNMVIPVVYTLSAVYIVQKLQGKMIASHIEKGGFVHSTWRAVLIGIIGLLITLAIIIVVLLITDKELLEQL